MKRKVDHSAMKVVGYTTPWSVTPGSCIDLHLSCSESIASVCVTRLDTPTELELGWPIQPLETSASHQTFDQGSYLRLNKEEVTKIGPVTALSFELYLTRNPGERTVVSTGDFSVRLLNGKLVATVAGNPVAQSGALPEKTWLLFRLSRSVNGLQADVRSTDPFAPINVSLNAPPETGAVFGESITICSDLQPESATLNAKISHIVLEAANGRAVWNFPTLLPDGPLKSCGEGEALYLDVVNQPTFCTLSRRWNGSSFDPRVVPTHYDAIHCHDDDMAPLSWPCTHWVRVPEDVEAGIYAFAIKSETTVERIVFFVSSSNASAPIVVILPTATYLAYSDEFLPKHLYPHKCNDRAHQFAIDNNLRSLYDYHSDASGVSICSYKKPKNTLRDDYTYPLSGSPHNLPVDLHFLRFLHRHDIRFDLITDHDLDERGPDALKDYSGVFTGSHPEYISDGMEASFRRFVTEGGSLGCLGGNVFAAGVAFKDDLMELRRSAMEAGRTWDGPVAELALSINNKPGGFLRHRGMGEFSLIGSAISLMGFETALPFKRTDESYAPDVRWIFNGVENETFGHDGIVLGGAAGYEVDATDPHLGTSQDTIVVARATGFPDDFFHDPTRWYEGGEAEEAQRRCAEMTLRQLTNGACIFTTGSVAWLGALPGDDSMNDVGRITLNLLKRFSVCRTQENSRLAAM